MTKKSRIIENVKIEKIWFGWIWIATWKDGKKILITWWALPNMVADLKIVKNKSDYIKTQIYKIHNFWKKLSENICKHHMFFDDNKNFSTWCWWCKWQILPYEEQINLKEQVVKDSFRWSDFFEKTYSWFVPSPKTFNYRNKMEFSFWKYIVKGEVLSSWSWWFHKQWMFSKIVDIENCLIAWNLINKVFLYIKNILKKSNLPVYDQMKHTWFFRHLVIRQGFNTNEVLVNLSVATKYFDKNKKDFTLWQKLQKKLKDDNFIKENVKSFVITENNWLWDVVRWKDIKFYNLFWDGSINEYLLIDNVKIDFKISAFSFFQTNTLWAQKLFWTAKSMLPEIKWNILDLYCWAWTIWLTLLKSWIWKKLLWVEIVEQAIEDAKYNAKLNNLQNKAKFIADKAENINFNLENIGLIVVDPPRSWLHKNVINFLWNLKKQKNFKLLYISCNPVTMNRDLKLLQNYGFEIKNLKAVDMFPHTHHIEMIGILE